MGKIVEVTKIRDALSYVVNPKAEFIVSDGLNEYDTNLTISSRRVAYDDDGQARFWSKNRDSGEAISDEE